MLLPIDHFHEIEIKDENNTIVVEGVVSTKTPLVNYNNTGLLDVIAVNLHYLNTLLENGGDVTKLELEKQLANVREYINSIDTKLGNQIQDVQNNMDSEKDKELEASIRNLNEQMNDFIRTTDAKINNVQTIADTRIDLLSNKVDVATANVETRLEQTQASIFAEIENLTNSDGTGTFDKLLISMNADIRDAIKEVEAKIDAADDKVSAQLAEAKKKTDDAIAEIEQKNTALIQDVDRRVNEVDREITSKIEAASSTLNGLIDTVDGKIENVSNNVNNFYTETTEKLDTTQQKLEKLDQDIDDRYTELDTRLDEYDADLQNRLQTVDKLIDQTYQDIYQNLNNTTNNLTGQLDQIENDYNNKIEDMAGTLGGKIDDISSTVDEKIEDLVNRIQTTVQDVSTVQGILGAAMSGSDSVAEINTRGDSLQIIAGKNNVSTLSPTTVTSGNGYVTYTFPVVPGNRYGIATRMSNGAVANYVTGGGKGILGENGLFSSTAGAYELGYIVGDTVLITDGVNSITVRSYNDPILEANEMVAVADISELANSYISQINLGNGVIQLAGKLITIDGDTIFNDNANIKGTMSAGKVEIGNSGVKLDKTGLSINLGNGSTIKYDKYGQRYVDSNGNAFAGIGRFMIGQANNKDHIQFATPWDITPNVILIPNKFGIYVGGNEARYAEIHCYATNVSNTGFDVNCYTYTSEGYNRMEIADNYTANTNSLTITSANSAAYQGKRLNAMITGLVKAAENQRISGNYNFAYKAFKQSTNTTKKYQKKLSGDAAYVSIRLYFDEIQHLLNLKNAGYRIDSMSTQQNGKHWCRALKMIYEDENALNWGLNYKYDDNLMRGDYVAFVLTHAVNNGIYDSSRYGLTAKVITSEELEKNWTPEYITEIDNRPNPAYLGYTTPNKVTIICPKYMYYWAMSGERTIAGQDHIVNLDVPLDASIQEIYADAMAKLQDRLEFFGFKKDGVLSYESQHIYYAAYSDGTTVTTPIPLGNGSFNRWPHGLYQFYRPFTEFRCVNTFWSQFSGISYDAACDASAFSNEPNETILNLFDIMSPSVTERNTTDTTPIVGKIRFDLGQCESDAEMNTVYRNIMVNDVAPDQLSDKTIKTQDYTLNGIEGGGTIAVDEDVRDIGGYTWLRASIAVPNEELHESHIESSTKTYSSNFPVRGTMSTWGLVIPGEKTTSYIVTFKNDEGKTEFFRNQLTGRYDKNCTSNSGSVYAAPVTFTETTTEEIVGDESIFLQLLNMNGSGIVLAAGGGGMVDGSCTYIITDAVYGDNPTFPNYPDDDPDNPDQPDNPEQPEQPDQPDPEEPEEPEDLSELQAEISRTEGENSTLQRRKDSLTAQISSLNSNISSAESDYTEIKQGLNRILGVTE